MKVIYWIAVLIGIYLLVSYYRGTASILSVFSEGIGKLVLFLQGRDANGKATDYPKDQNVGYYN